MTHNPDCGDGVRFFTYKYEPDVVADLLSAFTDKSAAFDESMSGYVITAFIVAGGAARSIDYL